MMRAGLKTTGDEQTMMRVRAAILPGRGDWRRRVQGEILAGSLAASGKHYAKTSRPATELSEEGANAEATRELKIQGRQASEQIPLKPEHHADQHFNPERPHNRTQSNSPHRNLYEYSMSI